jgi:hypothetical protein
MRQPLPRATALVAIITALLAATGFTSARPGPAGRERDRVVRVARGGPQRLDATDGIAHSHEETGAVATPATDLVDPPAAGTNAGPETQPGAIQAATAFQPGPSSYARVAAADEPPCQRIVLKVHAPDRAPPRA